MKYNKHKHFFYLLLLYIFVPGYLFAANNPVIEKKASDWVNSQSAGFIENKGQVVDFEGRQVPDVLFKSSTKGMDIYITTTGITYVFVKKEEKMLQANERQKPHRGIDTEHSKIEWCRVDMKLEGAVIAKEKIHAELPSSSDFNFYLAHCPNGIMGVKSYGKIIIKEIYPGIDWVIYNDDAKGLKYDFVVHPGANSYKLRLQYKGAGAVELKDENNLLIKTPLGQIQEGALFCYEEKSKKEIQSKYTLFPGENNFEVGFDLKNPNPGETIIIDPPLVWATFYGGSGGSGAGDIGEDMASDASGNIYITGFTSSLNFPLNSLSGAYYQGTYAGGFIDAFILKFNSANALVWATFYGGSDYDWGNGICTDAAGNVYVTGWTVSPNFPTQNAGTGFFQGTLTTSGFDEIFILKFNVAGVRQWATYYGGPNSESGFRITTDAAGNIYVLALASAGCPTFSTGGAYIQSYAGGFNSDAFILKFDSSLNLLWATYYGGSAGSTGGESAGDIAADASGNVFVTGGTPATDFPVLNPGGGAYFQGSLATSFDAYILKFNSSCVRIWATYYGGNDDDLGTAINIKPSGDVYLTLTAGSTDLPVQANGNAYYQATGGGFYDISIIRFDNNGVSQWATYYGGSAGSEQSFKMVFDLSGNTYIAAATESVDFPTQNPGGCTYYNNVFSGGAGQDIAIIMLNPSDSLVWATYYGGTDDDATKSMAVTPAGNIYLTGATFSTNFPTVNLSGAYNQPVLAGGSGDDDLFIIEFCPSCLPVVTAAVNSTICAGSIISLSAGGASTYTWSPSVSLSNSTVSNPTAFPSTTTTYTVTGTDVNGCTNTAAVTITVLQAPAITVSSNVSICSGDSAILTVSGGTNYSWTTGATTTAVTVAPTSSATYSVIASNGFCVDTATITVSVVSGINAAINGNTTICSGETATLVASGGTAYSWSNGNTSASILLTPTSSTTYSVIVSSGSCSDTASATVTVNPSPSVSVSGNVTICVGDIATLTASGGTNYSWNNGNTNSTINVSPGATTTYSVVTSNSSCTSTASVTVVVSPPPTALASGTTICMGQSAVLTASGGGNYSWSNGETNSSITISPTSASTYSVIVSIGSCSDTASASVMVNPNPVAIAWNSVTITAGSSATLSASGGTSYQWDNGSNGNTISVIPPVTTIYCVTVTDANGCTDVACVTVTVEPIDCGYADDQLFVPDFFSPNGDTKNDLLLVYYPDLNCIKYFEFIIYDRWGEKVFSASGGEIFSWDGTYKGKPMNTAVFVYYMKVNFVTGNEIIRKGNISLIR